MKIKISHKQRRGFLRKLNQCPGDFLVEDALTTIPEEVISEIREDIELGRLGNLDTYE